MMQFYDVVIIGGGVAGCVTALSLKQHDPTLSVAIIERGTYDRPRIGETLPPQTTVLFEQLGLWQRFLERGFLPAYGTSAAWGHPDLYYNEFLFNPYGHGWHLDRQAFDLWLAQEAESRGSCLLTDSQLSDYRRDDDGWLLEVENTAERHHIRSRFVVDATGRLADFARQQGARKLVYDQLVGIYRFFECGAPLADTFTLVEAAADGWWYSALLPDGRLVVALMTDADIAQQHRLKAQKRWDEWLVTTEQTQQRLADGVACSEPIMTAAHSQRLNNVSGPAWLAVGDAAATHDPLSSLGIFNALRTGIHASYAIVDYFKGDPRGLEKFADLVSGEHHSYLQTRRDYYRQEQRWPDCVFWQRRHQSDVARRPARGSRAFKELTSH